MAPKVVILISTSSGRVFRKIRSRGQESTWVTTIPAFSSARHLYLTSTDSIKPKFNTREETHTQPDIRITPSKLNKIVRQTENELQFECSGGWDSILSNSLSGMSWALANLDFDFLIRTNVSSYWDIGFTLELLDKLPKSNLYAGQRVYALGTELIEGSGIIFSRDVVEDICGNIDKIDANTIDDVAFGRFLASRGTPVTHIPRLWVRTLFDVHNPNMLMIKPHTIRCKFERKFLGITYRRDALLMKCLFHTLNKAPRTSSRF